MIKKLSIVFLFVVSLIGNSVCLAENTNQKDMSIILAEDAGFKFDFKKIHEPDKRLLILIISKKALERFNIDQKIYFNEFIINDDFSAENIVALCKKVMKKNEINNVKNLQFSTIDEGLVDILDDVKMLLGINKERQNLVKFRDKTIMKQYMIKSGIPIPKYVRFEPKRFIKEGDSYLNEIYSYLGPRIFAKPIDSKGSIGTQKVFSKKSLKNWSKKHLQYDNYELDEYIEGELYHGDSIIRNGQVIDTFVSKCSFPVADFLEGKAVGSIMMSKNSPNYNVLKNATENSLNALAPLPDGIMHTEIFRKDNGELLFLETAYRPAGGSVPEMYEKCININLQYIHTALQLNIDIKIEPKITCNAAWIWFPMSEGVFAKMLEKPKLLSEYETRWMVKLGQKMHKPNSIRDRAVGYTLWNNNYDELVEDYKYLSNTYTPYKVKQQRP